MFLKNKAGEPFGSAGFFFTYKPNFEMMEKINAVITGVGGYVPDYVLTNDELSRMVDTNVDYDSYWSKGKTYSE